MQNILASKATITSNLHNYLKKKLIAHVNDPNTIAIAGKYTRGGVKDVVHYYNPKTEINVMKDKQGKFISGWRLSRATTTKF